MTDELMFGSWHKCVRGLIWVRVRAMMLTPSKLGGVRAVFLCPICANLNELRLTFEQVRLAEPYWLPRISQDELQSFATSLETMDLEALWAELENAGG